MSSGGSCPDTSAMGISSNSALSVIFEALSRKPSAIFLNLLSVIIRTLSFSLRPMHLFRIMSVFFGILSHKLPFFKNPVLPAILINAVDVQLLRRRIYHDVHMVIPCPVRLKAAAQGDVNHSCYLFVYNEVVAQSCLWIRVYRKLPNPFKVLFPQLYYLLWSAVVFLNFHQRFPGFFLPFV